MKNTDIIKVLKANKALTGYELIKINKDSRQLFYVLDHLEINRAVKVEECQIVVYVQTAKYTGTSNVLVTSADDIKSLTKKINDAVKKAKHVKNAYYPLADKSVNVNEEEPKKKDLNKLANKIALSVFKADHYKNGWINSTEIFVTDYKKEFINSKGVKHISYSFDIQVECIPTWSNNNEEIELYKMYESGSVNLKEITEEIDEILNLAKLRSVAKTLKDVKIDSNVKVLIKNDMLDVLVNNIKNDLSYASVFTKQNHYKKGDELSNTKFDIILKPTIKGCVAGGKYDKNGIVLKAKKIIKDGKVIANHGDLRFGTYLKEKNITGELKCIELNAKGTNYKKEPHLIVETFSSPQLEEASGYWGGEIRLARYFDGKKYMPLTGLSISGNIYNDLKEVEFSKEISTHKNYKGPKYWIFKGISIH